jgi:hypothetical protein
MYLLPPQGVLAADSHKTLCSHRYTGLHYPRSGELADSADTVVLFFPGRLPPEV